MAPLDVVSSETGRSATGLSADAHPVAIPADSTPRSRAVRKPLAMMAGVALGVVVIGGLSVGAYSALSGFGKPRGSGIRMGRVDDLPEIKDGIVSIKPGARPAPVAPPSAGLLSPPRASAAGPAEIRTILPSPQSLSPQAPSPGLFIAPEPGLRAVAPVAPNINLRPAAAPAPIPAAAAPVPVAVPAAAEASIMSAPSGSPAASVDAPVASAPASGVPLPPVRAAMPKPDPRPERVAATRRNSARPAVAGPVAPEPAKVEAPAVDENRISVLGLDLPTGREIKEAVGSLGDAVLSIPSRF